MIFLEKTKNPTLHETVSDLFVAEGVGFEPTIRYNRIPDFESGAFDHSAILPLDGGILSELFKVGMLTNFLRPICVTPTNPIAAKKFFLRNLLDFSTKN